MENILLENSITPVQQYSYTTGKNATDSAMIIDAMDILYSGNVEGFCIVSSDSDFTRLAVRLGSRMMVIGMGERKTPQTLQRRLQRLQVSGYPHRKRGAAAGRAVHVGVKRERAGEYDQHRHHSPGLSNIITENGDEERGISIGELGKLHP